MWRVGRLEVYDKLFLMLALYKYIGECSDSSFRRFIPENDSQHIFDGLHSRSEP